LLLLAGQSVAAPDQVVGKVLARITVEAGKYDRIDTPLCVSLEAIAKLAESDLQRAAVPSADSGQALMLALRLEEIDGDSRTPVAMQIEPGESPKLWWILSGKTPAGGLRVYELVTGGSTAEHAENAETKNIKGVFSAVSALSAVKRSDAAKTSVVEAIKNDKVLLIRKGEQKLLQYNHAIVPPPQGQSELFSRSGFIHPLWSPSGDILTNIHPPDHIHHLGIWMPWTHTKFQGKDVDFWNLKEGQGTVRFVKFLSTTSGPVYGGFQAEQEHVVLKTDQGEKVVLKEVWDVRVYNPSTSLGTGVGGPDKGYWLVDFKSTQRCVADSPLYQIEYRYGGFGFRGPAEWKGQDAAYLTSEGKTRKDGHGTRARWCDTSGAINAKWAGVTHMSHPDNFRYPEPMRIWPEFENQVFFNWAPSQLGDWVMEPGKDHIFRYRLYVHEGKVNVADSERVWQDFAEPPEIKVEAGRPENAIILFDGTDFSHWAHANGQPVKWQIVDGAMRDPALPIRDGRAMREAKIVPGSGSIVTKRQFRDFKLHVEFKTPQLPPNVKGQARGNSGVYLQQRYEIQILDSFGLPPKDNECGSLYTVKAPDKNVCKQPGEWQSYDITFHAARFDGQGKNAKKVKNARITVWQNGVLIHDDVEIPNKTGAGQPEGPEPGPILLQEHGSEVMFRNIRIVPLDE
jgi:hypothetical protein